MPPPTRITLDTLPDEILLLILQYCTKLPPPKPDEWNNGERADLQALCRVSRHIRNISLPELYKKMVVEKSPGKIAAFLAAMQKAPHLAINVKHLQLYAPAGAHSAIFGTDEMSDWPYGGPLGLSLFRNLRDLLLTDEMVPVSIEPLVSQEEDLFPTLAHCAFQYGLCDLTMPKRRLPVANLIPFWAAPNLEFFSVRGQQLRLTSDGEKHQHGIENLADVPEFEIHCGIEPGALRELIEIRKPQSYMYSAPPDTSEGIDDFNQVVPDLAPHVAHLSYLWYEESEDSITRRPRLSAFTWTTSMTLSAEILAAFSTESETLEPTQLLCAFPSSLRHLELEVFSEYIHRRQFYNVMADLVMRRLRDLASLELQFTTAEVDPEPLYWNHRLVSEQERGNRGIAPEELYGANGQTIEHNILRKLCEHVKTKLEANFTQEGQDGEEETISD